VIYLFFFPSSGANSTEFYTGLVVNDLAQADRIDHAHARWTPPLLLLSVALRCTNRRSSVQLMT